MADRFTRTTVIIVASALALASCGPATRGLQIGKTEVGKEAEFQRKLYVESRIKQVRRVANLSYRLRRHAVALCKERTRHEVGIIAINSRDAQGKYAAALRETLKLGDNPRIVSVATGSPAETAGIKAGDEIVTIDGKGLDYGTKASKALPTLFNKPGGVTLKIAVLRAGEKKEFDLTPVIACRYPVRIVDKEQINAFADGTNIGITTGMIRFAKSDTELSLVIAHELAHNVMGHIDKRRGQRRGRCRRRADFRRAGCIGRG